MNTHMKRHLVLALASLFALAPLPALHADEAPPLTAEQKADLASLQGSWEGTETGHEADGKCTLTISGDAWSFEGWQKGEWYKATVTLAPAVTPKELVAVVKDCPAAQAIGLTAHAIYKLENGTLTLVGHGPGDATTPATFSGDANSRIFVFKKVQQ